ncbi:hypothetical protein [Actinomadura sp. GTD37]|uniref:hypothetical protein n=1 Tax=Actinomadura sp. GTD37 TaxID=1778030 RepID=UPI0035C00AED
MTVPPTAQDSDAALIEGSLADPEAFAALFDRYSAGGTRGRRRRGAPRPRRLGRSTCCSSAGSG